MVPSYENTCQSLGETWLFPRPPEEAANSFFYAKALDRRAQQAIA